MFNCGPCLGAGLCITRNPMKILDVRCGVNKHEGAIGVDNNPPMRFLRKFWEHNLSHIFRGKELMFEFEMVKETSPQIRQFSDAWDCEILTKDL